MVYDDVRRRVVLYGGHDGDNVFGDTWEWDGARAPSRSEMVTLEVPPA